MVMSGDLSDGGVRGGKGVCLLSNGDDDLIREGCGVGCIRMAFCQKLGGNQIIFYERDVGAYVEQRDRNGICWNSFFMQVYSPHTRTNTTT